MTARRRGQSWWERVGEGQVLPHRPCLAQPSLSTSHYGWLTNSPTCQGTEPWTMDPQEPGKRD